MFQFLKYLQPTHCFALNKKSGHSIFPKIDALPQHVTSQLEPDSIYKSDHSREYDLSWQAIQKGFIGNTETYQSFKPLPIKDEYIFIRKYFSVFWVYYVLGVRLLSLKNPFKEIGGCYASRNVKRSTYINNPITYEEWEAFQSKLVAENPKVSVVIPTLNRYTYLKDVLKY